MTFFSTQNPGIGGLDELTINEQTAVQTIAALGTPGYFLRTNLAGNAVEWAVGGGGGGSLKLPTLTVGASGADYTTIQDALDAIGVNGGKIYLTDTTYTITSAITFKGSGVEIIGNSNGTQINVDGSIVTTLVTKNATTYQRIALRDVTLNQTNGTVQGIGIDFSNISLAIIENVRILNFGTAILLANTSNNNFYSYYTNIKISGCNNGIDCTSTTPFNFNTFVNIRTALRAGGAGTGLILNNAQGNGFYNFNAEPATGAGITGVAMTTANVFDNNFYNLYCENNNIGVTMDSNTQRNNFYGGNVIASITTNFTDNGKYNQRYGLNVGTTVDFRNVYSNTRFVSTGSAPITLADFTNNTSFAHSTGSLVNMSLLNATDTSDTLQLSNASTSTGMALDIKNSFGFSRGTNFSTVGSSNNVAFSNHSYIRCNGASAQTITGIANGVDGRYLVLRNTTANPLVLNHEDTNSTATNRILCPEASAFTVPAGSSVTLIYDPSDTRWAVLVPDSTAVNTINTRTLTNKTILDTNNTIGVNVAYDFVVYRSGGNTVAKKTSDGTILSTNTDASVVLQAVVDQLDASTGTGGRIYVKPGTYAMASTVTIQGDNTTNSPEVSIHGAGAQSTIFSPASGVNGFTISNRAKVSMMWFAIYVRGTTDGIKVTNSSVGQRGCWQSEFKNIYINGDDSTHTGWGINAENFFRSVIENVDMNQVGNGMLLKAIDTSTGYNPGDSTFTRMFIELRNRAGGSAYQIDSPSTGDMNQMVFLMCEGYGGGTGQTGVLLSGASGNVNHTSWIGINLENFDTIIDIQSGRNNVFDLNYVITRNTTGTTYFKTSSNAFGNKISCKYMDTYTQSVVVVNDANTVIGQRNRFQDIVMQGTATTLTFTRVDATYLHNIFDNAIGGGGVLENGNSSVTTNAVTINATSGYFTDTTDITLGTSRADITLTNQAIRSTSVVSCFMMSAPDANAMLVASCVPIDGSCTISIRNVGAGNQTSTYTMGFIVKQ